MDTLKLNDGEAFHVRDGRLRNGMSGACCFGVSWTKFPEDEVFCFYDHVSDQAVKVGEGIVRPRGFEVSACGPDRLVKVREKMNELRDKLVRFGAKKVLFIHWGSPEEDLGVGFGETVFSTGVLVGLGESHDAIK